MRSCLEKYAGSLLFSPTFKKSGVTLYLASRLYFCNWLWRKEGGLLEGKMLSGDIRVISDGHLTILEFASITSILFLGCASLSTDELPLLSYFAPTCSFTIGSLAHYSPFCRCYASLDACLKLYLDSDLFIIKGVPLGKPLFYCLSVFCLVAVVYLGASQLMKVG